MKQHTQASNNRNRKYWLKVTSTVQVAKVFSNFFSLNAPIRMHACRHTHSLTHTTHTHTHKDILCLPHHLSLPFTSGVLTQARLGQLWKWRDVKWRAATLSAFHAPAPPPLPQPPLPHSPNPESTVVDGGAGLGGLHVSLRKRRLCLCL